MKLEEIRRNLLEGENKNQAIELLGVQMNLIV